MYIMCEGIQLLPLLTMWGSLGKELLNERVGETRLEDCLKFGVNKKRLVYRK